MAIPNGIIRFSGTWSGAVVYVYADLVVSPIDSNAYVLVVSSLSGGNDPSVPSANWVLMPSGGSGGTPTEITQGGATVACKTDGDIVVETITLLDGSNTNIGMTAGTFNLLTTNATSQNASIDITDAQIGINSNKNIVLLVGGNEIFVDKATDKISILADAEVSISAPLVTIDQIPPNAAPTSYVSYDASSKALSYTDPPLSANGSYESGVIAIVLTDAIPFQKK